MGEIEAIGSAFESMSAQNGRLLDGVTRRDEEFNKLTADNISLEHQVKELTNQCQQQQSLCGHLRAQIATHDQVMGELQGTLQRVMGEAAAAREAARVAAVQCEGAVAAARQREEEVAAVRGGSGERMWRLVEGGCGRGGVCVGGMYTIYTHKT